MIPHVALALAGAVGALVVPVVSASFGARPVLPAGFRCCPLSPLLLAGRGAVGMSVVAPPVNPEHLVTVPALSCSNFQLVLGEAEELDIAATWPHPGQDRRYLVRCAALGRCPRKARSGNSGPSFYLQPSLPASLAAHPSHSHFLVFLATWAPLILVKKGPRHAGGDTRSRSQEMKHSRVSVPLFALVVLASSTVFARGID